MSFNKLRYEQIEKDFFALREEYMSLEVGYSSRAHLQHIRKQFTELYSQVGELIKGTKYGKIHTELYRQVVLGEEMLDSIENEEMAITKADKKARVSMKYKQHVEVTAQADSDWEMVRHLADSIKQYIYTVASDIDSINEPKY